MAGRPTDIDDSADVVIVGSGPAGATAARWFAETGRSVVVLEEGGPARSYPFDAADALQAFRHGGLWHTTGTDRIALQAARCVGGSSAVSYGVVAPLAEHVHAQWGKADPVWATRLSFEELDTARDRVDQDLDIAKVPAHHWGVSGEMLLSAFPGSVQPVWRAVNQCLATGQCTAGCPTRAIASADRVQLPIAVRSGARLYSHARVDKIAVRDGRAVGVLGATQDGGHLRVTAKRAVFVCAGALHTPVLLQQSGVAVGASGLQLQVDALVSALLPEPLGQEQSAGITIAGTVPGVPGATVAAISVLPRQRAAQLPGVGPPLELGLDRLGHLVTWRVSVTSDVRGKVGGGVMRPRISYALSRHDHQRLLAAVSVCCDGLLRSGALEVYPQLARFSEVVTDGQAAQAIGQLAPRPGQLPLSAAHFYGGVAVDDHFQAGGVRGLVIADASVLPMHTGGPLISTIMAVATAVAQRWI